MKVKISNVLIQTQERLVGYVTEMSYGYAQLCVKADPSSLLSFEEKIDDKTYRMEDMARIVVHDKEGDDDNLRSAIGNMKPLRRTLIYFRSCLTALRRGTF